MSWRIADGIPEGSTLLGNTNTAFTDGSGLASVTVRFGSTSTGFFVEAFVPGAVGSPIRFRTHAFPGAPTRVVMRAGADQLGLVGQEVGEYVIRPTDSYGNDVGGVVLDWVVVSGGGTLRVPDCDEETEYCPPGPDRKRHRLGPNEGPQTVTVTASQLPGRPLATFTATAVSAIIEWTTDGEGCYAEFAPRSVSIPVGKTVGWSWRWCETPHSIVFEDGLESSPTKSTGWHIRRFTTAGTYRFRCALHSTGFTDGEVGTVTVGSGG